MNGNHLYNSGLLSEFHQLFSLFYYTVTLDTGRALRQTQYSLLRLSSGVSQFIVMLSKHVFTIWGSSWSFHSILMCVVGSFESCMWPIELHNAQDWLCDFQSLLIFVVITPDNFVSCNWESWSRSGLHSTWPEVTHYKIFHQKESSMSLSGLQTIVCHENTSKKWQEKCCNTMCEAGQQAI